MHFHVNPNSARAAKISSFLTLCGEFFVCKSSTWLTGNERDFECSVVQISTHVNLSKTTHCTRRRDSFNFVVFENLLVLINTKLYSKSCRYLKLYNVLITYSFPVARGIFFGMNLSCFVPQSADTKLLMLPLRTLHWHCWGHSDKQKQASIKNWYLNQICFQLFLCIQRYYQMKATE